jgi:hypothetical protein
MDMHTCPFKQGSLKQLVTIGRTNFFKILERYKVLINPRIMDQR